MNQQHSRFREAPWFKYLEGKNEYVLVGGAGGISSWLSLFLSRIGANIGIFDMDKYEPHNLGGQFAKISDIGKNKAQALRDNIREFSSGTSISTYSKYTADSLSSPFMFAGFDNMEARKFMFDNWFKYYEKDYRHPIFIDGRLLMEQMQIFCVTPETADKYRDEFLFSDDEVDDEVCSLKQTSHSAAMIAGFMTSFFTNHLSNIYTEGKHRRVPFNFEYFIPLNLFSDEEKK